MCLSPLFTYVSAAGKKNTQQVRINSSLHPCCMVFYSTFFLSNPSASLSHLNGKLPSLQLVLSLSLSLCLSVCLSLFLSMQSTFTRVHSTLNLLALFSWTLVPSAPSSFSLCFSLPCPLSLSLSLSFSPSAFFTKYFCPILSFIFVLHSLCQVTQCASLALFFFENPFLLPICVAAWHHLSLSLAMSRLLKSLHDANCLSLVHCILGSMR